MDNDLIRFLGIVVLVFAIGASLDLSDKASSPRSERTDIEEHIRQFDRNRDGVLDAEEQERKLLSELEDTIDGLSEEIEQAYEERVISPYADSVTLSPRRAREKSPREERVDIRVSSRANDFVSLAGWTLYSPVTKRRATLPEAVSLFALDGQNHTEPVALAPGEEAVVITGRSPVGISFRTNICSGFLKKEGRFDFNPPLSRQCPYADDDPIFSFGGELYFAEECRTVAERLSRCEIIEDEEDLPPGLPGVCDDFFVDTQNYEGCVDRHQNDADFFDGEWRLYLERSFWMWEEKRDIIQLLDAEGKLVDEVSYGN